MHGRSKGCFVISAAIAVGVAVLPVPASALVTSADVRAARLAAPMPSRGLVFTGLAVGGTGSDCAGAFEVRSRAGGVLGCTHGPDPSPPGVDVRRGRGDDQIRADTTSRRAAAAGVATGVVACVGDGISGARIQAIYAVAAGRPDRSATVVPAIQRSYAPYVDWQLNQSAAETGGEAHAAFVTRPAAGGSDCELAVDVVHLSAAGDDSFSDTVSELRKMGYAQADRKYLVWADADVLCGVADLSTDARPTPDNRSNGAKAMYARVDAGCWGYAEGHELMHTLGAVQKGAPHATPAGHCYDEPDEMCYNDDPTGLVSMLTACPGRDGSLFDCNHDDYFYAGTPPATNWLATHWNTYTSRFLIRGPVATTAGPAPGPTIRSGYWMLTGDGHVAPFGDARAYGEPAGGLGAARAVHLEATPTGAGYWILDDGGHVHPYGDATDQGDVAPGQLAPGETAVGLSATPTGTGYWIFTTTGRVLPFGTAAFFGDMSAVPLNRPVVGSVATPSGRGYYLFASDGGIFTFGDAAFHGSTGNLRLNRPVTAMAPVPGGAGYWLVASDGGVFSFGDIPFHGSLGDHPPAVPVVSVALLG